MVRSFLIAALCVSFSASADAGGAGAPSVAKILETLASHRDDMTGYTRFEDFATVLEAHKGGAGKHRPRPIRNQFEDMIKFYFGNFGSSGFGPLRLQIRYSGDWWIFARNITFKIGGELHRLEEASSSTGGCSWDRHSLHDGGVWETCDLAISTVNPLLADALGSASEAKIRFSGDRQFDWVVPKDQLAALRRVYPVWRAVSSSPTSTVR
jgi:hypothetical protein